MDLGSNYYKNIQLPPPENKISLADVVKPCKHRHADEHGGVVRNVLR
jgi:hypothetical protein